MVGVPAAGKTTLARRIARDEHALLLSTDAWMIPLFGAANPPDRRDVLEGRLVDTALAALGIGASAVLDFGLWGRDERDSLRALAAAVGGEARVHYLPISPEEQRRRVGLRASTVPHENFAMTDDDLAAWRATFQEPDAAEVAHDPVGEPPAGWTSWSAWASDRWPSLRRVDGA